MVPNFKRPKMTGSRLRRLKLAFVNAQEKRQAARFREMTAGLFAVPLDAELRQTAPGSIQYRH